MKTNTIGLITVVIFIAFAACSDETDDRDKFTGSWEVEEHSLIAFSPTDDYKVRIIKDGGTEHMVIITNFANLDIDVTARVEGNLIEVYKQGHNLFEFEGQGELSGSIIVLDYTIASTQEGNDFFDHLRAEMTQSE